jgi:hypothetical protein
MIKTQDVSIEMEKFQTGNHQRGGIRIPTL